MTISTNTTRPVTPADIEDILVKHTGLTPAALGGGQHTPLASLGIDSLAAMELQAVVADRYGVDIPEEEALEMTFNELVAYIGSATTPGGN